MADERLIGVFDSGVGGIGTLAEMTRLMPHERFLFYGDTAHAPYGTKSRDEVLGYVREIMAHMLARDVKAVAIACNTATSVAAAELRAAYDLPIIGIEPALKPAHEMRHGGSILVLATPMTLRLDKFQRLMGQYGEGAVPLPCPGLMELVEREAFEQAKRYLIEHFSPYDMSRVDAVVLGCTHYVFLRPVLAEILPDTVRVLDGNLGTARQLRRVLESRGMLREAGEGSVTFETSGDPETVLPQMNRLMRRAREIMEYAESNMTK
ncbi:MAG: glutamate racemase [Christensenellaceae bacterium]|nr:glutamate racemase [Christensenellaceae bacterium]